MVALAAPNRHAVRCERGLMIYFASIPGQSFFRNSAATLLRATLRQARPTTGGRGEGLGRRAGGCPRKNFFSLGPRPQPSLSARQSGTIILPLSWQCGGSAAAWRRPRSESAERAAANPIGAYCSCKGRKARGAERPQAARHARGPKKCQSESSSSWRVGPRPEPALYEDEGHISRVAPRGASSRAGWRPPSSHPGAAPIR